MRILPSAGAREAGFDLTPMIDVVLLLIIFFAMTSQFSESQNLPMDLPQERGDGGPAQDGAMSIVVDMDEEGALRTVERAYTREELAGMLAEQARAAAQAATGPLVVVVRADRRCKSLHLQRLGQALASAGILQWKLATTGTTVTQ